MFLAISIVLLINNIVIYLKFAKDLNLLSYIDNGDVNSLIPYSKKYTLLIRISLNPFFAVPENKMKQVLAKNPAFNSAVVYDRRNINSNNLTV